MNLSKENQAPAPLERLRTLLLDPEHRQLDEIQDEIKKLRLQFADQDRLNELLQPILAEALERKIFESRDEMAQALSPVMGVAIKKNISEAKEDIVDALYPIIGATIRKSIAEAMKQLSRSVNEKLNQAMSFSFFLNKTKARLRGVNSQALILNQSLPFYLQELFLIHKDSGILLWHYSNIEQQSTAHADVVGSMLSAIKDFAGDAFNDGQEKELSEIQYNELTIIIEPSRYFYIAAVAPRVPDSAFYDHLNQLSRKLHNRFYKKFREFTGDVDQLADAFPLLVSFMQIYSPPKKQHKEQYKSKTGLFLATMLIIVILFFAGKYVFFSSEALEPYSGSEKKTPAFEPDRLLQKMAAAFSPHLKTPPSIKFIVDGSILILQGHVATLTEKLLAASLAAEHSGFATIINNLKIEADSLVAINKRHIKHIEQTRIHFAANKTEPLKKEEKILEKLALLLIQTEFSKLIITGYSDNSGPVSENLQYSLARAQSIANFLSSHGIDKNKISVQGRGEAEPLVTNDTEEGRKLNRRVEFSIIE